MNKQVVVKKCRKGYVSVRDYVVANARKALVGVDIFYKGKKMSISLDELDKGIIFPVVHTSKYNNIKYKLIDYKWVPNEEI